MSAFDGVNRLVLCRDNYESQFGFENAIKDTIMLLLNADYVMVVDYDEKGIGIVTIDYNYADKSYGCRYPYWLLPEEIESVDWLHDE